MRNKDRKIWRRWLKAFHIVRSELGGSKLHVKNDDMWWYHISRFDEGYSKIRHFYSNSW